MFYRYEKIDNYPSCNGIVTWTIFKVSKNYQSENNIKFIFEIGDKPKECPNNENQKNIWLHFVSLYLSES